LLVRIGISLISWEDRLDDVRLGSGYNADSNVLALNSKYLAIPWTVKGSVCVVPLTTPGAVHHDDMKLIIQEDDNAVNHVAFHPSELETLITATNEKTAMVWKIPDGGLTEDITAAAAVLEGHASRVLYADFHPLASNVAVTHAGDKAVKLWDVEAAAEKLSIDGQHKGVITEVTWNLDGSQFATSAKDKFLRIFDPRQNSKVAETTAHDSVKTSRSVWCRKQNKIVSCGFDKESYRTLVLFDPRNFAKPVATERLEVSSSAVMPLFDEDTSVLFVCGKGDATIHMYEVADDAKGFYELSKYKSMQPQTGVAMAHKTALRVMDIEVDRIYKLTPNSVIPVSISIDRANKDFFQEDIFVETFDNKPTMSAADWFGGAAVAPKTVSLQPA
jgi:WD40 repeat protein